MFNPKDNGPLKILAELATPEWCVNSVEMQIKDLKVMMPKMTVNETLEQVNEITRHLLIAGALLKDLAPEIAKDQD